MMIACGQIDFSISRVMWYGVWSCKIASRLKDTSFEMTKLWFDYLNLLLRSHVEPSSANTLRRNYSHISQSFFSFSSTKVSTWLEISHCVHINVKQVLGRVIHIGVDAILVSAVLAGIKRSTGIQ